MLSPSLLRLKPYIAPSSLSFWLRNSSTAIAAARDPFNSATDIASSPTNRTPSLAGVRVYDRTPTGYGVGTFWGYLELIPPKTPLPCRTTEVLDSVVDYPRYADFPVYYRTSMQYAPIEIASVRLGGLRAARKESIGIKVRMEIGRDLMGNIMVWDVITKSTASIAFDGTVAARAQGSDDAVIEPGFQDSKSV